MVRTRRVAVATALISLLLVVGSVGAASAANPSRAYSFSVCYDGTHIELTETWSGFGVNEYTMGLGSDAGGFGIDVPITAARHGSVTEALGFTDDPTEYAAADLRFHGRIVATGTVFPRPSGGWATLPAC